MPRLRSIRLAGFTSVRAQTLELDGLNVLIGANGAGKSNLLTLFDLVGALTRGNLQEFVSRHGFASSLLHYGPRVTPRMEIELDFELPEGPLGYTATLSHGAGDVLTFSGEVVSSPAPEALGAGHRESLLPKAAESGNAAAARLLAALQGCRVFHFHDTSPEARIRNQGYIEDGTHLRSDAGNLAAFLFGLQKAKPRVYTRIVETIRQVAPFFRDFALEPSADRKHILLNWHERGGETLFGPHQLSDGTLRAMALIALLLQPVDSLPLLTVIDEPELGLHPFAVTVLADLLRHASRHTQVLISTQSTTLLDQFEPEQIVVVERDRNETVFRRLDGPGLAEWLEDYSVGELWEKNVLGGRPAA